MPAANAATKHKLVMPRRIRIRTPLKDEMKDSPSSCPHKSSSSLFQTKRKAAIGGSLKMNLLIFSID
jgi:hypothetical protein